MIALMSGRGQQVIGTELDEKPVRGIGQVTESVQHKVLGVFLEDPAGVTQMRLSAIAAYHNLDPTQVWPHGFLLTEIGESSIDGRILAINAAVDAFPPTVVIIDNLRFLWPMSETAPEIAHEVVKHLEVIARKHNIAIALIHHDRKFRAEGDNRGDQEASGSGAIMSAVRGAAQIISEDHGGRIIVNGGGSNYSESAPEMHFRREWGEWNEWRMPVLKPVSKPNPFAGISEEKSKKIRDEVLAVPPHERMENVRNGRWAGLIVAKSLGIDVGQSSSVAGRTQEQNEARERVKSILTTWVKNGALGVTRGEINRPDHRDKRFSTYYVRGPNS